MSQPSQFHIRQAAAVVRNGGVIAYPTEAVYGLGCDPHNADAIERLLDIKQRDPDQGLIVIAAHIGQLDKYIAPLAKTARSRLLRSWPGPQTWVVPARDRTPQWLTGRYSTIAVRITAHPIARALCLKTRFGLVSTSANLSGLPPARDTRTVRHMLGDELDYILGGPVGSLGAPTPIKDLMSGKLLRA